MSEIPEIRAALARRLASIPGLNAADVWPDAVDPPMAIVHGPSNSDYELTFGGNAAQYTFEITVIVDISALRGLATAQRELDAYIGRRGPYSIEAALLADPTLGGLCDTLFVRGIRSYGQIDVNDNDHRYAAGIELDVRTAC